MKKKLRHTHRTELDNETTSQDRQGERKRGIKTRRQDRQNGTDRDDIESTTRQYKTEQDIETTRQQDNKTRQTRQDE